MKKCFLFVLFFAVALHGAEVETPWNKVFASGKIEESVAWRLRIAVGEKEGQKFIQLGKTPKTPGKDFGFNLKQVPVEPNALYKLVITAEVEGTDTVDDDPKVIEALRVSNKSKFGKQLPGWVIYYINEKNKHYATEKQPWSFFYRKGKFDYVHLFYAPASARAIVLRCHSYGNQSSLVKFYKFTLEKLEGDIRNVNPDFAPGAYNCSGYSYGGKLWRIVEENGKVLLKCNDSWVMGDPVPVKAGEKYTLTVTGTNFGKRHGSAGIFFLKGGSSLNGTRAKQTLYFRTKDFETKSLQFVVPDGVTRLRTSLSRGSFTEVKLIREK